VVVHLRSARLPFGWRRHLDTGIANSAAQPESPTPRVCQPFAMLEAQPVGDVQDSPISLAAAAVAAVVVVVEASDR